MKRTIIVFILLLIACPQTLFAEQPDLEILRREMQEMRNFYEKRIQELENNYKTQMQALEKRIQTAESIAQSAAIGTERITQQEVSGQHQSAANSFNPAISLILNGRYSNFSNDPDDYELPGFTLSGEAGLGKEGLSVEHTELAFSANVDDA